MFSVLAIPLACCVRLKCTGQVNMRTTRRTAGVAFGLDMITGLALLILGSLSVCGILPRNTIRGGILIGLGCVQLILAFPVSFYNGIILGICKKMEPAAGKRNLTITLGIRDFKVENLSTN